MGQVPRFSIAGAVLTVISLLSPAAARAEDAPWADPWHTTVVLATDGDVMDTAAIQPSAGSIVRKAQPSGLAGPRIEGDRHGLTGIASYYWQGQQTATGERFNPRDMTAAHRTLPFGTKVRVTRLDTGTSVVVRINDRGPFKPGRVIDLSERAAEEIGMKGRGLSRVQLEVLAAQPSR